MNKPIDARSMSGLEMLRGLMSRGDNVAAIGRTLNFHLVEVEHGRTVFEGLPGADHLNPLRAVHGGYAATLLDSCMGCAVHSALPPGRGFTTLELKVNYIRAMHPDTGVVRASGELIHLGRSTATAEGRLVDRDGRLIAHGTTTCILLDL